MFSLVYLTYIFVGFLLVLKLGYCFDLQVLVYKIRIRVRLLRSLVPQHGNFMTMLDRTQICMKLLNKNYLARINWRIEQHNYTRSFTTISPGTTLRAFCY